MKRLLLLALVPLALVAGSTGLPADASRAPAPAAASAAAHTRPAHPRYVPPVKHVFVINIENKGYGATWGDASAAPYLAKTLRAKGVLLSSYYATAHNSQPNYVAQISGQGPNPQMQSDCQNFSDFQSAAPEQFPGQAVGEGCVFPKSVASLPKQLSHVHLRWRGYLQQMRSTCQHPTVGTADPTQHATAKRNYAVRHNPFVYFHGIIDNRKYCKRHVVQLTRLPKNLEHVRTTPNLVYITPDLCRDGHDAPCANGAPGGLKSVDVFMKKWVPRILRSPAFKKNGMLVITADESDSPFTDSTACCGEGAGPNSPQPGIIGMGGGHIGALVISQWSQHNSFSSTPYNHYSLLASLEEIFRLPKLGYARTVSDRFGLDVYNTDWYTP